MEFIQIMVTVKKPENPVASIKNILLFTNSIWLTAFKLLEGRLGRGNELVSAGREI